MTREPKPSPDLEKLASKTAQKMAKECAERMESEESYDFTPAILSALNEAVRRMNEKIALKCEIAVAERTLDWLKCRKVLDDEIDRLTAENTQMREALNFIQNNLLAWNKVVRDDTISDSAIRGAACIRIAALHEITRAALAEKGEPADAKGA